MSYISAEAAVSAINFCHSHSRKYRELMKTGWSEPAKLGVKQPGCRWMTGEDDKRMVELRDRGWSMAEIAREVGCSDRTVRSRLANVKS